MSGGNLATVTCDRQKQQKMNNIKTLVYVFFKTKTKVKRMMDMHFVIFFVPFKQNYKGIYSFH